MAVIVTRAGKGSPLTNAEVDQNFINLNAGRFEVPALINLGPAPPPLPINADTALQIVGATGKPVRIELNAFGSVANVHARQASGTAAAPTATGLGAYLLGINAEGRGATGWPGAKGQIAFRATEAWTDAATGTDIAFSTTSPGTNVLTERWKIGDAGHFLPNGPYDIGAAAGRVRSVFGTTGDFSGSLYVGNTSYLTNGLQAYATGFGAFLDMVRSNGTAAAPTGVKAFDQLGAVSGKGRGATAWSLAQAALVFESPADWTDASMPGQINILTTPVGSNTIQNRWQFNSAGHLVPFTNYAYDIGGNTRIRTLYAGNVDLAGPNAILTLAGRSGAGTWGIYSTDGSKLQFWNGTTDVAALASNGNLTLNGTLQAGVVAAGPSAMMAMSGQAGVNSVLYFDAVTPGKLGAFVYQFPGNTLDVILGGSHVGVFNPADQSLTVDGTIRALNITAVAAGSGSAVLNPGGISNSGYLSFFDPANTRIGYFGFADTATKTINIAAEAGYAYRFGASFSTAGEVIFGAQFDTAEPRGRYWSRPAPSGSYTLDPTQAGGFVVCVAAAPMTITIPPQSAGAWKSWSRIDFVQYTAGQVTFAPGAGVTLQSAGGKRKTTGPLSAVSLIQINPDEWLLVGDLAL